MTSRRLIAAAWMAPVVAGSLAFPLALLYSRTLLGNRSLVALVDLQSSTTFFSFLIQAGLRAGIRKEYLTGNARVVALLERFVARDWIFYAAPVSLGVVLLANAVFLPVLCTLNAIYTLFVGMRLVQVRVKDAAYFAGHLFFANGVAAGVYLFGSAYSRETVALVSEGVVAVAGMIALRSAARGRLGRARARRTLVLVLRKYLGLQVSSLLIVLHGYIFAQLIVEAAATDFRLALYYSDAVLVSGLLLLVMSRLMLVFEKRLVEGGAVARYLDWLHLAFVVVSVAASLILRREPAALMLSLLFTLSLFGRYTFAVVSGFIEERLRKVIVGWLAVAVIVQAVAYVAARLVSRPGIVAALAAGLGLFTLSVLFTVLWRGRDIYIDGAAANAEG